MCITICGRFRLNEGGIQILFLSLILLCIFQECNISLFRLI
ncbi:hypothetical protein [Anaerobutyricum hallii]